MFVRSLMHDDAFSGQGLPYPLKGWYAGKLVNLKSYWSETHPIDLPPLRLVNRSSRQPLETCKESFGVDQVESAVACLGRSALLLRRRRVGIL